MSLPFVEDEDEDIQLALEKSGGNLRDAFRQTPSFNHFNHYLLIDLKLQAVNFWFNHYHSRLLNITTVLVSLHVCKRLNISLPSFNHDTIASTKQPWLQSTPLFSYLLERLLHLLTKMETWTGSPTPPPSLSSTLPRYHPWMRISQSKGTVQGMATLQQLYP